MNRLMRLVQAAVAAAATALASGPSPAAAIGEAQQRGQAAAPRPVDVQAPTGRIPRNPRKLTAIQLLEPTHPGRTPHVRFEWDAVPEARAYVLYGRWVGGESWAVQTREFRVTARTATAWDAQRVAFDVALPPGSHSWNVIALTNRDSSGEFTTPAEFSFELR